MAWPTTSTITGGASKASSGTTWKGGPRKPLAGKRVINRAGKTFRKLPTKDAEGPQREQASDGAPLMIAQPSMIKRPVLEAGGKVLVGFKPEQYEKLL